jgi:Peptidase inhibitor I78 family
MKSWTAPALLALAACTTAAPRGPEAEAGVKCDATATTDLVGKVADATLGSDALKRSGARTIRWLRPDSMMTMDYRVDRLNVRIDAANRVAGFTCG